MARRAAFSPSHGTGSRSPKRASEGMVWIMLAMAMTGLARRSRRVRRMPSGRPMAAASSMALSVSQRCSKVRRAISQPRVCRKGVKGLAPFRWQTAGPSTALHSAQDDKFLWWQAARIDTKIAGPSTALRSAQDDKFLWWQAARIDTRTAGPSTALRCAQDDKFYE